MSIGARGHTAGSGCWEGLDEIFHGGWPGEPGAVPNRRAGQRHRGTGDGASRTQRRTQPKEWFIKLRTETICRRLPATKKDDLCHSASNLNSRSSRKPSSSRTAAKATLRPLRRDDEKDLHQLFLGIPEPERMFIKHRVQDINVIRDWCRNIDYGRNLPLLGLLDGKIVGVATLHQQLGGWKRHIGRVSVLVHPQFRGRGLAARR